MLWTLPYVAAIVASIAFALLVIYLLFGGGMDSHNPRASFPLRTIEKEFLEQYVADGKEETGYLHRPRDGSKSVKKNQLVKIFYRYWHPKYMSGGNVDNAKGVVVVLHGLNSHSARNNTFMVELLNSGFVVAGLDHEGFGRSDGRHGYFENMHHMADDVIALIHEVRSKYKGRKVFLHGGSLGGLLVLLVLLKIDASLIDGAVILCPVVQIHTNSRPSKILEFIGNVLLRVGPKLPLVEGNRGKNCHPDVAAIVEASKCEDPMFYNGKLRIGSGFAILDGVKYIQDKLHTIKVPYLLQHGTADYVCHLSGSEQLHSQTSSEDKTFISYPDCAHDISNERKHIRDAVVNDFVAWLEARV